MTDVAARLNVTRPRAAAGLRILLPGILVALALVAMLPAVLVILGGFLPELLFLRGFGALIIAWLPWVDLLAITVVLLGVLARLMRKGKVTAATLVLACATLAGAALITTQLLLLAIERGASYSVVRAFTPDVTSVRAPDARVRFATVGGMDLHADIWQPPAGAPAAAASGRAAVMFIHGGGFSAGALGDRPTMFNALAADGIVVVDIEYRLAPPPRWDQAPEDTLCALGWLDATGPSLGVDPTKIVVVGESAGGNLALMAAYGPGSGKLASSCGGNPAPPAGVISIAPTADLVGIWHDRSLIFDDNTFPVLYIGGTPGQYPDRYAAASPFSLIRAGLPPTLVITGANDRLVRLDRVNELVDRLGAAGVPYDYLVVPYADHVFNGAGNAYGEQLLETVVPDFIEAHT